MKKALVAALVASGVFAQADMSPDLKVAKKEYLKVECQQLNKYKKTNNQLKSILDEIANQNSQLLEIVKKAQPAVASLDEQAQFKKLTQLQNKLKNSNPEFKQILEARAANYKKRNMLLREISPEYKAASKNYYLATQK